MGGGKRKNRNSLDLSVLNQEDNSAETSERNILREMRKMKFDIINDRKEKDEEILYKINEINTKLSGTLVVHDERITDLEERSNQMMIV